jgi:hypothetical protein
MQPPRVVKVLFKNCCVPINFVNILAFNNKMHSSQSGNDSSPLEFADPEIFGRCRPGLYIGASPHRFKFFVFSPRGTVMSSNEKVVVKELDVPGPEFIAAA